MSASSADDLRPTHVAAGEAPIDSLFHQPVSQGLHYIYSDRYEAAVALFDSLQLLHSNHPAPYFYKAVAYELDAEFPTLRMEPGFYDCYFGLGSYNYWIAIALRAQDRTGEAYSLTQQALRQSRWRDSDAELESAVEGFAAIKKRLVELNKELQALKAAETRTENWRHAEDTLAHAIK